MGNQGPPDSSAAEVNPYASPSPVLASPSNALPVLVVSPPDNTIAWIALAVPVVAGIVECFASSDAMVMGIAYGAVIATSVLIALDASLIRRKVNPLLRDGVPVGLLIGGILLWIVAYPLAFFLRRKYGGAKKFGPLSLAVAALFLGVPIAAPLFAAAELPACDSPEVKELLERIVNDMPSFKQGITKIRQIDGHQEIRFDAQKQIRTGRCTLKTETETVPLTFTVSWQDRGQAMFYVQLVKE